ncbi:universal stress protein [Corynebacterium flavescens]|uniref:universal stress protein n=1 Tax=Corynebacterium flavescens TaxID=28028 RepID=UPI003FD07817
MLNYSVIAVGTNGSETSMKAVQAAASLARVYGAKLLIVSAFYDHAGSLLGAPNSQGARLPVGSEEMAESYLDKAAAVAKEEGAESIEIIGKSGDPAHALLEVAKAHDVDLLVVGNKGLNSMRGRVFGSVPTELTHKSKVDVVVVNTSQAR